MSKSKGVRYVFYPLIIIGAFVVLAYVFPIECQTFDNYFIGRITKNLSKLQSYEGVIEQEGLIDGKTVRAKVYFKNPNMYLSKIVAPESYKDVTVLYRGSTLLYYYPNIDWAIRFKDFEMPSQAQLDTLVADNYRKNMDNFDYKFGKASTVADLPVLTMYHEARSEDLFNQSGKALIYDEYSFSLAGEILFKGGARYAYTYQEVEFNKELPDELFSISLPEYTVVSEWDLSAPSISLADMKAAANFKFSLPDTNPFGLSRERIVSQGGLVPAFAVSYRKGLYFVIVSLVRDYGLRADEEYGLPIKTSKAGKLIISPSISSFSFTHNEVIYTVMGNLSVDELLEFSNYID